jgi:hypothetical protein
LTLPIARDARPGRRLVTVGAIAVTADCSVVVEEDAEGGPSGDGAGIPGARYLYTTQFLCGTSEERRQEGVARGEYQTLVTLTNPSGQRVEFAKRISQALPEQEPGELSAFVRGVIEPHRSISMECDEIGEMLHRPEYARFQAGTVLILARERLEVTAVYSSRPPGAAASTIQVVPVSPQLLQR